jgi:hypothetical protein
MPYQTALSNAALGQPNATGAISGNVAVSGAATIYQALISRLRKRTMLSQSGAAAFPRCAELDIKPCLKLGAFS